MIHAHAYMRTHKHIHKHIHRYNSKGNLETEFRYANEANATVKRGTPTVQPARQTKIGPKMHHAKMTRGLICTPSSRV